MASRTTVTLDNLRAPGPERLAARNPDPLRSGASALSPE